MSWLISLVLAGAVFTAGNIPSTIYENTPGDSKGGSDPVLLDESERFEKSYPFSANGTVSVSNVSGSIDIKAWDKNEIKLIYVKKADTKEALKDAVVNVEADSDSFVAKVKYDKSRFNKRSGKRYRKGSSLNINFELMVPKTAKLDEIENVAGTVSISNMVNYSHVSVVSGTVTAKNLRGTAKLRTVSGTVNADFNALNKGSSISLVTVTGTVNLTIPSDSNATVRADTVTGSIKNDFGLYVHKGKYVGTNMHGKIGGGNVKIKLSATTGSVSVRRKSDGKKISPSTNLLKPKSSDDDDETFEMDVAIAESRIEKAREAREVLTEVEVPDVVIKGLPKIADIEKMTKEALRNVRVFELDKEKASKGKRLTKAQKKKLEELEKKNNVIFLERDKLKKRLDESKKVKASIAKQISEARLFGNSPYVQEISDSIRVKGVPRVEINAQNCDVIVRSGNSKKVEYTLSRVKRGRSTKPIELRTANENHLFIKVIAGVTNRDRARLEVSVPKKSQLEIHSGREIRLTGISGKMKLYGGNDAIIVRDSSGWLRASSRSGMIRVIGFEGGVSTKTSNGEVMLEGDFNEITAKSFASNVTVTLPRNANAKIVSNAITKIGRFEHVQRDHERGYWVLGGGEAPFKGGGEAPFKFELGRGSVNIRTRDSINAE